jgi:hypothetical protein
LHVFSAEIAFWPLPAFMPGILAAEMHLRNTFARKIVWPAFILSGALALVGEFESFSWGESCMGIVRILFHFIGK